MRTNSDIVILHKDSKFYGSLTYGDFLKDEERLHSLCKEKELKADVLPFVQYDRANSPSIKIFRLGIIHLLLDIESKLDAEVRVKVLKLIDFDYIKYETLVDKIAFNVKQIYERSVDQSVGVDMIKFKTTLFSNINIILEEIEGDLDGEHNVLQ